MAGRALDVLADRLQQARHGGLLRVVVPQAGERRNRHVGRLVVGRARERRVHDHQVHRPVRQQERVAPPFALPVDAGRAGRAVVHLDAGPLEQPGAVLRADQVERAQPEFLGGAARAVLPAVRQQVHLRPLERGRRVGARQHRGGQMRRRRHDVGREDRPLQHPAVDRRVVAPRAPVPRQQGVAGGGDQRAGAAGEVARPQSGQRAGVPPVGVEQPDRQLRQQRGRLGPRVERRQELAVADQPLKGSSVQIVRPRDAVGVQLARHAGEPGQQARRRPVRDRRQHFPGHVEDRPVVDAEDPFPLPQHRRLRQDAAPAQVVERPHVVDAGQHRLEGERVGDDRHRHPRRLLAVLLAQRRGDAFVDGGTVRGRLPQPDRGLGDAGLQHVQAARDGPLRDRRALDHGGEVVHPARDPAGGRPAHGAGGAGGGEEAVLVPRPRGPFVERRLRRMPQRRRRPQREALLDGVARVRQLAPQPRERVLLHRAGRRVLALDHHRRAPRVAHDQIGQAAALDRAVLLGGQVPPPAGMLRPQHAGERLVEGPLAVDRHASVEPG